MPDAGHETFNRPIKIPTAFDDRKLNAPWGQFRHSSDIFFFITNSFEMS